MGFFLNLNFLFTHEVPRSSQKLVHCIPGSNWNLEMLVFEERGKQEYPKKTSRSRVENQQQTQPTYDGGSGNTGERRALLPLRYTSSPEMRSNSLRIGSSSNKNCQFGESLSARFNIANFYTLRRRGFGNAVKAQYRLVSPGLSYLVETIFDNYYFW